jgi:hypothetical protein
VTPKGHHPHAGKTRLEITFGPNLGALLAGEPPHNLDPAFEVPDFPPAEWGEPAGEEPHQAEDPTTGREDPTTRLKTPRCA